MSDYIELPRFPMECGAFVPPSQFEGVSKGKGVPHSGWRPTIFVHRKKMEELLRQQEAGKVNGVLLWELLLNHSVSPALAEWFRQICPLLQKLEEKP